MTNGRPQNGRAFDPSRRAAFLAKVTEGASVRVACRLVGVDRKTVRQWTNGAHHEHRAFAAAYHEAIATGTHAAYKRLEEHAAAETGGNGSVKATLAVLAARDPRFGDIDLRRTLLRKQIERAQLENEQIRFDTELAQAKTAALRMLVSRSSTVALGLQLMCGIENLNLPWIEREMAREELTRRIRPRLAARGFEEEGGELAARTKLYVDLLLSLRDSQLRKASELVCEDGDAEIDKFLDCITPPLKPALGADLNASNVDA